MYVAGSLTCNGDIQRLLCRLVGSRNPPTSTDFGIPEREFICSDPGLIPSFYLKLKTPETACEVHLGHNPECPYSLGRHGGGRARNPSFCAIFLAVHRLGVQHDQSTGQRQGCSVRRHLVSNICETLRCSCVPAECSLTRVLRIMPAALVPRPWDFPDPPSGQQLHTKVPPPLAKAPATVPVPTPTSPNQVTSPVSKPSSSGSVPLPPTSPSPATPNSAPSAP